MTRDPGNWVASWKPYNWGKKTEAQITSKKDQIRTLLKQKFAASFTKEKRENLKLRIGWYVRKTRPGIYKTYCFIRRRKGGGGNAIVNPRIPPQP